MHRMGIAPTLPQGRGQVLHSIFILPAPQTMWLVVSDQSQPVPSA